MDHEPEGYRLDRDLPGQLARDRGGFLEGPTGLGRARREGLSGGVRDDSTRSTPPARPTAARACASEEGRAVTRLASAEEREQGARPRGRLLLKAGGDGWMGRLCFGWLRARRSAFASLTR